LHDAEVEGIELKFESNRDVILLILKTSAKKELRKRSAISKHIVPILRPKVALNISRGYDGSFPQKGMNDLLSPCQKK